MQLESQNYPPEFLKDYGFLCILKIKWVFSHIFDKLTLENTYFLLYNEFVFLFLGDDLLNEAVRR